VKTARNIPIRKTNGKYQLMVWPDIKTTIESGISPIKKLTRPASAAEIAKICGGT
jgi:hypothetical protein